MSDEFAALMLNVEPLSGRDLEFIRLIADGKSNPEISRAVFLGVNTIKTHLKRIFTVLGVNSRAQAVYVSMKLGLID